MKVLDLHFFVALTMAASVTGCGKNKNNSQFEEVVSKKEVKIVTDTTVQEASGKKTFRHETFGNEGFWTDAARMPQGIADSKLTPLGALKMGLSINAESLDADLARMLSRELVKDGMNGQLLNDSRVTLKIINSNAFIGLVAKDTNGDGKIDVANGDKLGMSCVLCHGVTDKSVFELPGGGSIGKQIDGPAQHRLNLGALLSVASNTRAFYPLAQIKDEDGLSIGRAASEKGLDRTSTEVQFDAYFSNTTYFPVGSFDDTLDGMGNPLRNAPAFRVDLSAPFGSAGEFEKLSQYSNHMYTGLMDPTNILTKAGKSFMQRVSGSLGAKLVDDYADVLAQTNVSNYPYVKSETKSEASLNSLLGVRVDETKLQNMEVYLSKLRAPKGVTFEKNTVSRGEELFKNPKVGCTSCHNADQTLAVMKDILSMNVIFKGDNPVAFRKRDNLVNPLQNTAASTYDDKMIVINASLRGLNRGVAMPLLMDLAKKPAYLHDGSVPTLYKLLDPNRGENVPHAYYIESANDRNDLVTYLKTLDDDNGN